MDYEYWLNFYGEWTREKLIIEISTCHKYQLVLLEQGCKGEKPFPYLWNLMVQSQTRQLLIWQVLEEKIKNGD